MDLIISGVLNSTMSGQNNNRMNLDLQQNSAASASRRVSSQSPTRLLVNDFPQASIVNNGFKQRDFLKR